MRLNYLRISITEECNLSCIYCGGKSKDRVSLSAEKIIKIAEVAAKLGMKKVRLTGGEPLLHNELFTILERLSSLPFEDISITTNGTLLLEFAEELKRYIKRVNISLDTLCKKRYKEITGEGLLFKVLQGIEKAKMVGFHPIKINTVLLKGINEDEIDDMLYFAKCIGARIRFIELMPVHDIAFWKRNFLSAEEVRKRFDEDIEFIASMSSPSCKECKKLRVTPRGEVKRCLFSSESILLSTFEEEEIEKAFLISAQKKGGREEGFIPSFMSRIGG